MFYVYVYQSYLINCNILSFQVLNGFQVADDDEALGSGQAALQNIHRPLQLLAERELELQVPAAEAFVTDLQRNAMASVEQIVFVETKEMGGARVIK